MKNNTHPVYKTVTVTCACGETFLTGTTKDVTELKVDVCSKCHPYYTGKQKAVETGGRIDKFNKRYNRG
ncbi:MAG: 50S ribosomal protein L31 [Clostridia bacterium]|nr:50S ribosomal protein L31 [Clostridia bacterium]